MLFLLALIPYVILCIVAYLFFNLIVQIKKNVDKIVEQNQRILSLLDEIEKKSDRINPVTLINE